MSVMENLPPVRGDATQLEMALLNLVSNALDAMPGGGTLSITVRTCADGIRLEIADTGGGIPSSIVDRLFEPWVTTKPAGQGSGLGLAIVPTSYWPRGRSIIIDLRTQCSSSHLPPPHRNRLLSSRCSSSVMIGTSRGFLNFGAPSGSSFPSGSGPRSRRCDTIRSIC
jgi:hypothetical protein